MSALFDAVEHQDIESAKSALDGNGLDINQVNEEEFTALDIAVMSNNIAMAKLLLSYGARENPRCKLLLSTVLQREVSQHICRTDVCKVPPHFGLKYF